MIEVDISKIKKTFAIYRHYNRLQVQLQYNNKSFTQSFEVEEDCVKYIKSIIGEDEYNKREFESFNYNFKKHINDNNLLTQPQKNIRELICKRYSGTGINISRKSHISKNKTLTLYDLWIKLNKQSWKCYYSKLNFDINISYMSPSIDRIDSCDIYSIDNCVVTLEFCQFLKNAYSLDEFKRCINSIATGYLDDNETTKNSLIGGGKKKGIKKWKQIDINRPLKMGKIQFYIYEILKNENEYLSRIALSKKINDKFGYVCSKGGLHTALNKNNYILVDITKTEWKYKLKDEKDIRIINENTIICCGSCKKEINIIHFRKREAREGNKGLDLNLYHTICTDCNTKCTNNYKNKGIITFILRQISGRIDKKGNITKKNFYELKGSDGKCAITGITLNIENNSGRFNQASPDRIDSTKNYDVDNVQIICLAINLAKRNYNISNETIILIIKNIHLNIENF